MRIATGTLLIALLVGTQPARAQEPPQTAPLPPAQAWSGKSRALIVPAGDPWITPAEKSGFRASPSYAETVAWLKKLMAATPDLRMISIGRSPEGRDIWMVLASHDRLFTPEALARTGKPLLFAQAGIHAGEIDGKDAALMLLRDLTVGGSRRDLLDRVNLAIVPIFNVDGHERTSRFGRINQRGPESIGWRTNARNLNLNRDYAKLDTEEVRGMVSALDHWKPDLYLDLHVTDGLDYQYDITFGWNETTGYSPEIARWLGTHFRPAAMRDLHHMGHIPGPLIFPAGGDDLSRGLTVANYPPRFSHGYGDARHLATVLVENHSLKPYEQRVLGTLVLLESAMESLGRDGNTLRQAIHADRDLRPDPIPLDWSEPKSGAVPETLDFLGIESRSSASSISGGTRIEFLGRPTTLRLPVMRQSEVRARVTRPKAYWVPAAWSDIVERLTIHGIRVERIAVPRDVDVEMYRITEPKLAAEAVEGRVRLVGKTTVEKRRERFVAGSYRVPLNQPLGELAAILLEPSSPDSFFQWGFFHQILQRTEYVEGYILEPMAEQMMAANPTLRAEFERRLADDEAFRKSPEARLRFFYERTPYFDERWRLYPIAREP